MNSLLITKCHILSCQAGQVAVLRDQDLLISGNRIADVKQAGLIAPGSDTQVIDANGQLAMPGLINTHAHVPMSIFRGLAEDVNLETWFNEYMWPLESNLTEEDVFWGMLLGLVEMIEAGVTSVADHYFHMDRAAKAVEKAGTRAALGWAVFGNQGEVGLTLSAGFAERYQGAADGRITTWMAPHAPYTCDDDFLTAAAREAERLGVGIHIHAAETSAQTEASLATRGVTPIQILEETGILDRPTILAHCCGVTSDDIERLVRYGCGVAHAPKTHLKLSMGTAPILRLRAAGVPVGLATDGPVSNNTLDVWESMRLMALMQKHESGNPENLTVADAVTIATRESARVYGLPDDLGQITVGALADLILVDLTGVHNQPAHDIPANLVYSVRASDVTTTIVDGRVLMRDRQLLTLDKAEIVDQVVRSMGRLAKRVPESRIQLYRP